jgi:dTMP kinase
MAPDGGWGKVLLARSRGRLVAIEGIDQAGKKTQTQLLAKDLRRRGYPVSVWEFPDYSTRLGRQLKSYLAGEGRLDLHAVHLLYSANRWEVAEKLEREIRGGANVVVNRYWPSNLAYGIAHGLPADWLVCLDRGLPKPDLVIVLDISPRTSLKRKRKGRDVHEGDLVYLRKVRNAYLRLARKYGWKVVDGARDSETIQSELRKIVSARFR